MRSRNRLTIKNLKLEDFKCDLTVDEKLICDDCGIEMKYALQIIGKRAFCKACSPWYQEQAEIDAKLIDEDMKRITVIAKEQLEAELDSGERDYWD